MSIIERLLEQILSARYGRDVRQSIHDAIWQCYLDGKAATTDDAMSDTSANPVQNKIIKAYVDSQIGGDNIEQLYFDGHNIEKADRSANITFTELMALVANRKKLVLLNDQDVEYFALSIIFDDAIEFATTYILDGEATQGRIIMNSSGIVHRDEITLASKASIPTVPQNVSAFTNDANYLTLETLPRYSGAVI